MDSISLGKILLLAAAVLAVTGLALVSGVHLPLGRLPGDFHWKKDGVNVYFPLATSVLVSMVLTLILRLFRR